MVYFKSIYWSNRVGLKTYLIIALCSITSSSLNSKALVHLNFPTYNMFKACKLIPVMIGSILILGTYASSVF